MHRVFADMDDVVVDFSGFAREKNLTPDEIKRHPNAYFDMKPIPGAIEALHELIRLGFEVFIAAKPPTGVADSYRDKALWIFHYIPELSRHLIITPDKGLLGDEGDFLCDDRPEKANCEKFRGTLLRFQNGYGWKEALEYLRPKSPLLRTQFLAQSKL